MKNAFPTITDRMTYQLMQQIHAFRVIVIQRHPMAHVTVLAVNVTVDLGLRALNVRNVFLVTKVKTAPDVHVTKEEPCTVVNVNPIVNVR